VHAESIGRGGMDDLTQVYRDALVGRIEALEVARGTRPEKTAESAAIIRRVAHSLRGSGGTFGFPEISRAAAAVEEAPDTQLDTALQDLLIVLRAVARGSTNTARVLIVHGDASTAARLRELVAPLAAEVELASTRAQARELLGTGVFDLVMITLSLPDGDGRELLVDLRQKPATPEVPVLLMACNADPQQKAECFRLGADAFFDEPVDPELVSAVATARLQRAPARTPMRAAAPTPERAGPDPLRSQQEPLPAMAPKPTSGRRAILLVEDDAMVAAILRHRLDREGFEVLHFTDGVQALAGVEGKHLALAILDIKVPGMDGFELLERLRRSPSAAGVPIMMLTALGAEQDVVRGFGLGADDYMIKPFSPAEVMARVNRLLKRKT
jgi:DNA-binding response OmpR family regulator